MMQMFRGIRTGAEEVEFHNAMVEKYPLIDRLKDIITLNENALDLIEKYKNSENVFLMLDPPYIEENYTSKNKRKDIYEKELKKANQHLQLLNIVKDAKAKVLICTYKNKLYDEVLCSNPRWKCIPVVNTYKFMSIGKTGSPKTEATEYIYINYTPESGLNAKK